MGDFTFSIGIRRKTKKDTKDKKHTRRYIHSPSNQPLVNYTFIPYTGKRWRLPEKWSTQDTLTKKFNSVTGFSDIYEAINHVKENTCSEPFLFSFNDFPTGFEAPPLILDSMIRYKNKEQTEWKTILYMLLSIKCISNMLTKYAIRFKVKKAKARIINTVDVVTMEIPVKPIYITDMIQKCTYVYEASTLFKAMTCRLLTSDYMFVNPMEPINLLSNEPFRLGQNIAVFNALKAHGEISWVLDRFRLAKFNINTFKLKNKQALKLESISFHFLHQPECSKETVIDYFDLMCDKRNMEYSYVVWFKDNYNNKKYSAYIQKWITLTRKYYEFSELNEPIKLEYNARKCNILLDEIKDIIQ
jgi:hypothetical protein